MICYRVVKLTRPAKMRTVVWDLSSVANRVAEITFLGVTSGHKDSELCRFDFHPSGFEFATRVDT